MENWSYNFKESFLGDEFDKKLYVAIALVSMIASGCYLGFGKPRENPHNAQIRLLQKESVIVRENGQLRKCLVDFIYKDANQSPGFGADTLDLVACRGLSERE